MHVVEDFMMFLFGVLILIVIPVTLILTRNGYAEKRALKKAEKEFLEAVREEGGIRAGDYIRLKNAYAVISGDKAPKVSVIHLEAEKGKILSDHFYIMTDEEIQEELSGSGQVSIKEGMAVFVDE
ncbi:MAG: hypothetical protein J6Z46_08995 [Lachnospiraceae bacterium]|nr:hypothetical protein [Lachnospiraceae bacterium]